MSRMQTVYQEIEHYYQVALSGISAASFTEFAQNSSDGPYGGPCQYARQMAKGMSDEEFMDWWVEGRGAELGMLTPSQRQFIIETQEGTEYALA